MKNYSQAEINAIFRQLGLATEAGRKRFKFRAAEELSPGSEQVHVFIRTQANTAAEEDNRNAKLA